MQILLLQTHSPGVRNRFEILYRKLYLQDIYNSSHGLLDDHASDGSDPHHLPVPGISYQTAGDVNADGNGNEFLQLAQAAKLSQHDLTEHQLAGRRSQSRRHRIKQLASTSGMNRKYSTENSTIPT